MKPRVLSLWLWAATSVGLGAGPEASDPSATPALEQNAARLEGLVREAAAGGAKLLVGEGDPVARRRAPEGITFGEMTIPPAARIQAAAHEEPEPGSFAWRAEEMCRRGGEKKHRWQRAAEGPP